MSSTPTEAAAAEPVAQADSPHSQTQSQTQQQTHTEDALSATARSHDAKSNSSTPRRAGASPRGHLPVPPEFLLIADLFKKPERKLPTGPPKNIEVLTRLAQPLRKNRKFKDELEAEEKALKARSHPAELPEPKNIEFLKKLAEPLPKNKHIKFELIEEQEEKALTARLKAPPKAVSEPKNMEAILRLSAPLPRNINKKFSVLLEEEEAAKAARAEKLLASRDQLKNSVRLPPSAVAASPKADGE